MRRRREGDSREEERERDEGDCCNVWLKWSDKETSVDCCDRVRERDRERRVMVVVVLMMLYSIVGVSRERELAREMRGVRDRE